jgi:hypothetical protein
MIRRPKDFTWAVVVAAVISDKATTEKSIRLIGGKALCILRRAELWGQRRRIPLISDPQTIDSHRIN